MSQLSEIQPFADEAVTTASIYIVEYDDDLRRAFRESLECRGEERVLTFATGREFKNRARIHSPGCVVLDATLRDGCGIEVIESLRTNGSAIVPVVTLSDEDVRMTVRAIQAGAMDVLSMPISPESLREAVSGALTASIQIAEQNWRRRLAAKRLACLTAKQSELLQLLISGWTNKSAAECLGLAMRTAERTRALALERLGVRTLIEYVQLLHESGCDNAVGLAPSSAAYCLDGETAGSGARLP